MRVVKNSKALYKYKIDKNSSIKIKRSLINTVTGRYEKHSRQASYHPSLNKNCLKMCWKSWQTTEKFKCRQKVNVSERKRITNRGLVQFGADVISLWRIALTTVYVQNCIAVRVVLNVHWVSNNYTSATGVLLRCTPPIAKIYMFVHI